MQNQSMLYKTNTAKCFSCGRPAVVFLDYFNRGYCRACFLKLMIKRLRKELSSVSGLRPDKEFLIIKNELTPVFLFLIDKLFRGFHKARVVDFYINKFDINKRIEKSENIKKNENIKESYISTGEISNTNIKEINKTKIKKMNKKNKTIILEPTTLEYFILSRFQSLSKGLLWKKPLFIPVMKSFSEFEIQAISKLFNIECDLKGFNARHRRHGVNNLRWFIEELQKKHPNSKFSALNVFSWIDKFL